jgi:hypothetical protein
MEKLFVERIQNRIRQAIKLDGAHSSTFGAYCIAELVKYPEYEWIYRVNEANNKVYINIIQTV